MFANNETGVIFPSSKSPKSRVEERVLLHTDAVQAVGKVPIRQAIRRSISSRSRLTNSTAQKASARFI